MISVIVPNYNHAPYLRQRIESILNQTYQDFELILLDDCSNDNSRDLLLEYETHPKVSTIIFNETNSGSVFRQWHKGVDLAKGDYIWIAESDDWAEPELLEILCSKLDFYPNAGLVFCNSAIYQNGIFISDFAKEKKKKLGLSCWEKDYIVKGNYEVERALIFDCTINNASAVLFRKNLLLPILPQLFDFRYSGDWFSYLQIAMISDIAYSSKTLNNYREHSGNVSKNAGYDYLIELFKIYAWLMKTNFISKKVLINAFHAYVSDVYSTGLKWNAIKDLNCLYKIHKELYFLMTWKLLRRKIKHFFK